MGNTTNGQILQAVNAVAEQQRQIAERLIRIEAQAEQQATETGRLAEASEENRRTLRGSNGTAGLVAQVQALQERASRLENHTGACGIADVHRLLNGDGKDPGLIERVRSLESLQADIRKWMGLVIGAIVLGLINALLDAAPKIIELLNR